MNKRTIGVFLFVLVVNVAAFFIWTKKQSSSLEDFVPATYEEILTEVSQAPGPVTVVNLWATWCEPCKKEMPYLVKLEQKYRQKGLRLILVSMDFESQIEEARKFLKDQGIRFKSFYKTGSEMEFINGLLPQWSGALPVTAIYGPQGKFIEYWQGEADFAKFESAVKKFLK